jgi:hypothetical protein
VVDIVSEDEIEPLQTLPKRGKKFMLSSEESGFEVEMLIEMGRFVKAWGKWKRTGTKTKSRREDKSELWES